jgi:RNA 3'-terminal phosphate cyclase (ATP)
MIEKTMIEIDGSAGEGGGQILRNSCAWSLLTGRPFHITNIRGKRPKPGLLRQHLTSIEAACAISGAQCEGLGMGAHEITFHPGKAKGGDYRFAVGTAGSTGLVLQAILMPLALADAPSHLVLEGGTHADHAPPFDFLDRVLFPILNRMGPQISARIIRHGFYPRGGGRIEVDITPAPLRPLGHLERGEERGYGGRAVFGGLPFEIAKRMLTQVKQELPDWDDDALSVRQLPDDQGPGVILMIEARFDGVTELISGFGKHGVRAESLAKTAVNRLEGYRKSGTFAGPYLADQLVLPFFLAGGGSYSTVKPSQHTLSALEIAQRFTGRDYSLTQREDGAHVISVL